MTQNQRHDSAYADLNLFPSETSKIPKATAETSSIPERLTRLIWRYPFGLLAGIWLVSVLIALLAFGGLTDPGADPAPQAAEPSPLRSQSSSPESIPQPSSTTAALPRAESSSAIAEISQSSTAEFPGWSLLLLVGACAGGCFVLSRCLQQPATASTPEANRRSSRRPIAAKGSIQAGPKRLRPFEPQLAQPADEEALPAPQFTSAATGSIGPASWPASTAVAPRPTAYEATSVVTVLPAEADHPLDWPGGSLAHQLDIRQQRSLSSLL